MTISNTIRTAGPYIGNDVTTVFPFYFKIFKTSDLLVVQTDVATGVATSLVLNSGYTVTLNADQNANPGGIAILPAALTTGKTLVLTSDLPYLQPVDITNGGGFYPSVINAALDRLTIFCQQLYSLASRSLKFPLSDTGMNTELPSSTARANNLLGFDSNGRPVVVAPAEQSATALQTLLATVVGASLIGTADGRTVEEQFDMLTLQWFNVTDPKYAGGCLPTRTPAENAAALQSVSAAVMAAGGGVVFFPPSSSPYITGGQTFAGATGMGYSYQMLTNLDIRNCPNSVFIEGYGAVLKLAPNLKFGSFNPVTGLPAPSGSVADNAADAGVLILLNNNQSTNVEGLELDGNSSTFILGGSWGGTGYQRYAYGLHMYGNNSTITRNVYTHHNGTDGIVLGYEGATADMPMIRNLMENVRSEYNSRQALSWVGGTGLTAINCKFNYTGRGAFLSAPAAGLDIEAEGAVVRNGHFINCEFGGNASTGMVADSGDSADVTFEDCRFYGVYSYAVWVRKPRFKFIRCLIAGGLVNTYTSPTERDRTQFIGCTISANEIFNGIPAAFSVSVADVGGQNPIFDSTIFVTNNVSVGLQNSSVGATYRNCKMIQNGSTATVTPRGIFEGVNTISMVSGTADLSGSVNIGKLSVSGTISGVVVAGGEVPQLTSAASFAVIGVGSNGAIYVASKLIWQNIAPTSGTYQRGDKCINNNPTVGQPKGWVCTVSGTPGTWVSEGNL